MGDTAGTIRKVLVDGVSYDVMADTDVTETASKYLNESIPTSGRNIKKMTARAEVREGIVIACNPSEQSVLKNVAESTKDDIPLSYVKADGSQYTCEGWIEFESVTTMENRGSIKMYNRTEWESFVAN